MVTIALTGRQNVLPPLQGLATPHLFTGVSPLPMVLTPLRGYPSENETKKHQLNTEHTMTIEEKKQLLQILAQGANIDISQLSMGDHVTLADGGQ